MCRAPSASRTSTAAPGSSCSCPSVTTRSPGGDPFDRTTSALAGLVHRRPAELRLAVRADHVGVVALLALRDRGGRGPRPRRAARRGGAYTSTTGPGQSASSSFGMRAFRRMVPVVGSTALSTKSSVPAISARPRRPDPHRRRRAPPALQRRRGGAPGSRRRRTPASPARCRGAARRRRPPGSRRGRAAGRSGRPAARGAVQ